MKDKRVNMADPSQKNMLLNYVRTLPEKTYRVDIVVFRERRTDRQNRAYWPCIVQPLTEAYRERGYRYTEEQVHKILAKTFLTTQDVNEKTGELGPERVKSTTELNTKEFAEYVEQCAQLLAEEFQITVQIGQTY